MKNKKKFSISRQKSYLTAGVITLAAVIAMAGIYYKDKGSSKQAEQEAIVMAETERTDGNNQDAGSSDDAGTVPEQTKETAAGTDKQSTDKQEVGNADINQKSADAEKSDETDSDGNDESAVRDEEDVETVAETAEPELHFSSADSIGWPINGDVILNYSMDKSVYFATLDQYKYNPAVVIHGEVNDKVVSAAAGQVISVDTNAETGLTVTVGLGDGYQAVYGQLKEVELEAGDYISRGDTIGFINEPTKYYSVEGSNLYFAMTKNGNPVNPLDYFD